MIKTPFTVQVREAFITGFLVSIPAIVSIFCAIWLFDLITAVVPILAKLVLPEHYQDIVRENTLTLRLIGLLMLVATITIVGFLARHFVGQAILRRMEDILLAIPLVRPVYSTVRQIAQAISASKEEMFRSVVLLEYPRTGCYAIGFVTAEAPADWAVSKTDDFVGVFLPTTPNPTSGYLLYLPRRELQILPISVADGMRLIVSGGVIRPPGPATPLPGPAPATSTASPRPGAL